MTLHSGNMDRGLLKTVDWWLVAVYLILVLTGWVNIFSAVQSAEPSSMFDLSCNAGKQILWIGISAVLGAIILFVINPRLWQGISSPIYIIVLLLLVAVIFVSKDVKGSHSWFELGPVKFQPAEISKITTSLLLASYISRAGFKMNTTRDFLAVAFIVGMPMLSIIAESETGSALVYLGFLFVLYREGFTGWIFAFIGLAILLFILTLTTSRWTALAVLGAVCLIYFLHIIKHTPPQSNRRRTQIIRDILVLAAGSLLILSTQFAFNNILKEHQQNRIMVLLGMKEDLMGVGYNVHQSLIAIGSGGVSGKGFLQGTQTAFGFVPEQSTDFIFCTVGEEWGFFGALTVILLYSFLIWRIISDAEHNRETFTRVYGYCLASCLFMHLFINIGMTIGIMPVIGIPLPLLSYGGSSLVAFTVMIFIFIALDRQDKKYF